MRDDGPRSPAQVQITLATEDAVRVVREAIYSVSNSNEVWSTLGAAFLSNAVGSIWNEGNFDCFRTHT